MSDEMTISVSLATLALRLEHLNARVQAENIARLGAGSASLFSIEMDKAYVSLQQAVTLAGSGEPALPDANTLTNLRAIPVPASASADDFILSMTRASSRYQALADGIGRQYSLMTLAIRGAR